MVCCSSKSTMKAKKKGKVHPSPLPPSNGDDCLSVLKLLPTVILVLVSALSAEDREVLAYLITRSLNTTTTESSKKKKKKKKRSHKWDCDCFDCYTSYWFRWDSSPNRELIHQIIDAFEDHLSTGEDSAKKSNSRRKKKERSEEVMDPTVTSDELPPETSDEKETSMKIVNGHKGLARKVLPDVLSLFNSRFWSFWNPNA